MAGLAAAKVRPRRDLYVKTRVSGSETRKNTFFFSQVGAKGQLRPQPPRTRGTQKGPSGVFCRCFHVYNLSSGWPQARYGGARSGESASAARFVRKNTCFGFGNTQKHVFFSLAGAKGELRPQPPRTRGTQKWPSGAFCTCFHVFSKDRTSLFEATVISKRPKPSEPTNEEI